MKQQILTYFILLLKFAVWVWLFYSIITFIPKQKRKVWRRKIKDKTKRHKIFLWLKRRWKKRKRPPLCHNCIHYYEVNTRSVHDRAIILGRCSNEKIPLKYRNAYSAHGLRRKKPKYAISFFYYLSYPLHLLLKRKFCGVWGKYYEPIPDIDKEHLL